MAGAVDVAGSLSPNGTLLCTGEPVEIPSVTWPTFTKGEMHTVAVDCPDGNSTTTTNEVSYTAEDLTWTPAIPSSFPNKGTFTFTATVTAQPDDDACTPFAVTIGDFTVTVIDGVATTQICAEAGYVEAGGQISPSSDIVCVGGDLASPPVVTNPTFHDGVREEITKDCIANTENSTTVPVVYTAEDLVWDPPLSIIPSLAEGSHQFTATVTAGPEDNALAALATSTQRGLTQDRFR